MVGQDGRGMAVEWQRDDQPLENLCLVCHR